MDWSDLENMPWALKVKLFDMCGRAHGSGVCIKDKLHWGQHCDQYGNRWGSHC